MGEIWTTFLFNPIFNLLIGLYKLTGSLGFSIIIFTALIRVLLIPAMVPSLKIRQKQQELKPLLDKLKKKYKDNKKKLAEKQMELMKKHGVNPTAGCITPIVTIILMIAVYKSVSMLTSGASIEDVNSHVYFDALRFLPDATIVTKFLHLDLSKPDPIFLITIVAVILQFFAGKMMLPYTEAKEKAAKKTPEETDDIAASMQKQSIYMMPIMFLIFGMTLPSGVMLYIIVSTLFQLGQTYFFTGWGGLQPWINKLKSAKLRA